MQDVHNDPSTAGELGLIACTVLLEDVIEVAIKYEAVGVVANATGTSTATATATATPIATATTAATATAAATGSAFYVCRS